MERVTPTECSSGFECELELVLVLELEMVLEASAMFYRISE